MKFKYLFFTISIVFIASCSVNDSQEFDNQNITANQFTDLKLQKIYDLQNQRNSKSLLNYLYNSKAKYRNAAAKAFASVQDSSVINHLLEVLKSDKSMKVRISAAYAIGQTKSKNAQSKLIDIYNNEKLDTVKIYIAEAIGKNGDSTGLHFLIEQLSNKNLSNLQTKAVFTGIARFFIRKIYSQDALETLIKYIDNQNISSDNLYIASIALARAEKNTVKDYDKTLIRIYNKSNNVFTEMNIVSAISKHKSENKFDFIKNIVFNEDCDYRLKVNAISSLSQFSKRQRKMLLKKLLQSKNPNVSIRASEFVLSKGNSKEAGTYLRESKKVKNWRTKANLLSAALKYSNNKEEISKIIKQASENSKNVYEKAYLLSALGYDIENYKYLSSVVYQSKDCVTATYGMEAISTICNNPQFEQINNKRIKNGKADLKPEFAYFLKKAISSRDVSKVAIAASIIRTCKLNVEKEYGNTYFLTQALHNCHMPKDLEAYIELQKTIAFLKGEQFTAKYKFKKSKVDWSFISQIDAKQKVTIQTNKGDITIQLDVNNAPVSVANFLNLVKNKSLNNKYVHRVVPNFVVQDGCPRGDGWGSPNYTIYSEFATPVYTEGSVGMASAGKDTEATQWFITHSPTPHLDGKYSNFGIVVAGMEVVHKLEVGDKIVKVINN